MELWSGLDQVEWSDLSTEDKRTGPVENPTKESNRIGDKEDRRWARDSLHVNHHQARADEGVGGYATRTKETQHQDRSLAGDEIDREDPHVV